jgi:dynein heavy chain
LSGPTGTGKTTLIKDACTKISSPSLQFVSVVLSSRTTCKQVAEQVESKLDKKGARNIIGPKNSKMIIYVDDFNMPVKEKYGAQPPI